LTVLKNVTSPYSVEVSIVTAATILLIEGVCEEQLLEFALRQRRVEVGAMDVAVVLVHAVHAVGSAARTLRAVVKLVQAGASLHDTWTPLNAPPWSAAIHLPTILCQFERQAHAEQTELEPGLQDVYLDLVGESLTESSRSLAVPLWPLPSESDVVYSGPLPFLAWVAMQGAGNTPLTCAAIVKSGLWSGAGVVNVTIVQKELQAGLLLRRLFGESSTDQSTLPLLFLVIATLGYGSESDDFQLNALLTILLVSSESCKLTSSVCPYCGDAAAAADSQDHCDLWTTVVYSVEQLGRTCGADRGAERAIAIFSILADHFVFPAEAVTTGSAHRANHTCLAPTRTIFLDGLGSYAQGVGDYLLSN
jgi:hypothetical protein